MDESRRRDFSLPGMRNRGGVLLARIGCLAILEPAEAGVFPVLGAQAVEIEPVRAAVGLMLAVVFAGSAVALLRLDRHDDSDTPR